MKEMAEKMNNYAMMDKLLNGFMAKLLLLEFLVVLCVLSASVVKFSRLRSSNFKPTPK